MDLRDILLQMAWCLRRNRFSNQIALHACDKSGTFCSYLRKSLFFSLFSLQSVCMIYMYT